MEFKSYPNIPPILGVIISKGKATLKELQEFYSLEDAVLLFDILQIDAYNEYKQYESLKNGNHN